MFTGACAGSTGGGIKVSRFIIMFKTLKREAFKILHPQAVQLIKLDKIPSSGKCDRRNRDLYGGVFRNYGFFHRADIFKRF